MTPTIPRYAIGDRVCVVQDRDDMNGSRLVGATGTIAALEVNRRMFMGTADVRVMLDAGTFTSSGGERYCQYPGVWFRFDQIAPLDFDDNTALL